MSTASFCAKNAGNSAACQLQTSFSCPKVRSFASFCRISSAFASVISSSRAGFCNFGSTRAPKDIASSTSAICSAAAISKYAKSAPKSVRCARLLGLTFIICNCKYVTVSVMSTPMHCPAACC